MSGRMAEGPRGNGDFHCCLSDGRSFVGAAPLPASPGPLRTPTPSQVVPLGGTFDHCRPRPVGIRSAEPFMGVPIREIIRRLLFDSNNERR